MRVVDNLVGNIYRIKVQLWEDVQVHQLVQFGYYF